MRILYFLLLIALVSCSRTSGERNPDATAELRIVSLSPSISKELESLGMGDHIVGATSYCEIAQNNKNLIVGSVTDVNEEKIIRLEPDIVFVSNLCRPATIKFLNKMKIKVQQFEPAWSYEQICENFKMVGELVGKEQLVMELIQNSRSKVDSLRKLIPPDHTPESVFFQIGSKPLFTVIPNTYLDDYIRFSGCENIASDLQHGTVSREFVLARNPDIIIIVTMGMVGGEEENTWKAYPDINAVKNNRIFLLDANKASVPTVESFTETLEQIFQYIYNK